MHCAGYVEDVTNMHQSLLRLYSQVYFYRGVFRYLIYWVPEDWSAQTVRGLVGAVAALPADEHEQGDDVGGGAGGTIAHVHAVVPRDAVQRPDWHDDLECTDLGTGGADGADEGSYGDACVDGSKCASADGGPHEVGGADPGGGTNAGADSGKESRPATKEKGGNGEVQRGEAGEQQRRRAARGSEAR